MTRRATPSLTLETLQYAFMGSAFFPLVREDGVDVIGENDECMAFVQIVGGAILVKQVGEGHRAEANARLIGRYFEDVKAGKPPEERAKPLTFSVLKDQRFLFSGISLDDALTVYDEHMGHACVIDDATGKLACLKDIEHACVCETCEPHAWTQAEAESLAEDVAIARAALDADVVLFRTESTETGVFWNLEPMSDRGREALGGPAVYRAATAAWSHVDALRERGLTVGIPHGVLDPRAVDGSVS